MKLKIITKKENPLLGRKEITAELDFEGATPSNQQVAELIKNDLKGEVILKKVHTDFSKQLAKVEAFVYDSKESRDKAERMTKHLRKKVDEDKKKADEKKAADVEAKKKEAEEKAAAKEVKEEVAEEKAAPVEAKEEVADKKEEPSEEKKVEGDA